MRPQVVVTGLGAVTPLGNDVPSTWQALLAGQSGVRYVPAFEEAGLPVQIAAEVKGFDAEALLDRRMARRLDRFAQLSVVAAGEALADADLHFDGDTHDKVGVLVGTGIGGINTLIENLDVLRTRGPRRVSALMVPMMMPNAAAGQIAIMHGLRGPALAVVSACATGANALGEAAEMIRRGQVEVMVAGGVESVMQPVAVAAFASMGAVSRRNHQPERACRPFDADRDGFVLGEGAGVIILESLDHARARGARIHAELTGYGVSADAFHITAPDEDGGGAALAMRNALMDAGLRPDEVDYVNAHGTSTPLNDRTETLAIRRVFGAHADRLVVSATKSMTGHLIGAAGAVEAIACIKTLQTGFIHPTINYETPDPDCDLDYVPNVARQAAVRTALSNSFGFGGHNASLIFQRWDA
jgi:3-oxoacyl-[acyl-carrier-protein] synthase II